MRSTPIRPRDKFLWHPDKLAQLRATGKTSAPINVEIDLSNRCSLGCQWCHFAYTHTRGPLSGKREKPEGAVLGGDLMHWGFAYGVVNALKRTGARSITWTGGGEPTLHPNFKPIVVYAEATGLAQGTYTHGGHIAERKLANVLKRTHTFVYVSLDACDAESYKQAKGVDRFDAACNGIRLLAEAEGDATIGVGFLLHRDNWHQARAMAELAAELGADYAQFRPTILYDIKEPGTSSEDTNWITAALKDLGELEDDPRVSIDLERFRQYRDWQGHGYETCYWSMLQTCITPNGKVWACVNKREHAAAEIGDLTTETFEEIWRRHTVAKVTGDCRVMCRGHLANETLNDLMTDPAHMEFV